ncbi:MAG: glycosyltransferase family 2 protein [Planctomycetes bacterium]|nr:glycosyltransferase family 2 protein [Planctomycetota bacterium]
MKITAAIIAKDEADHIAACVQSVAWCDEVVVLDSGSRDGTPALARAAGARVVETDWPGWVAQKNRAAAAATHDWVLSIDADERVDARLRAAIERVRAGGEPDVAAFEMTRHTFVLGRWIDHGGWYPEWRTRLFDRRRARWAGVDPHDRLEVDGPVRRLAEGELVHYTYRSISAHVAQIDRFTTVAAREKVARGRTRTLLAMLFRPPARFLRMYVLRLGFLDGRAGFVLAAMAAWYVFLKYAKVWEATAVAGRRGDAGERPGG